MRAFLNKLSNNKIDRSDATNNNSQYNTEELMGKFDAVDQTSSKIFQLGEAQPAQKMTSLFPDLQHNSVSINHSGLEKFPLSIHGLNGGHSQTYGDRNNQLLIASGAGRQSGLTSFLSNPAHNESAQVGKIPALGFTYKPNMGGSSLIFGNQNHPHLHTDFSVPVITVEEDPMATQSLEQSMNILRDISQDVNDRFMAATTKHKRVVYPKKKSAGKDQQQSKQTESGINSDLSFRKVKSKVALSIKKKVEKPDARTEQTPSNLDIHQSRGSVDSTYI